MKKLLLLLVFISNFVFAVDLKEKTLGIIMPFDLNPDKKMIPDQTRNEKEFNCGIAIPIEYLNHIKAKNVFKDVIEIKNEEEKADYYIKGYIVSIALGSGAARHFVGAFGGGLSHIKANIEILDAERNKIAGEEIFQKGSRGSVKAAWSNTKNLMTAVNVTKKNVYNLVMKAIGEKEGVSLLGADVVPMLLSGDVLTIREACQNIRNDKISASKEISEAFAKVIDSYISNPDKDKMAVDAMAWVCIAIAESKSKDNISDLEKIISSDVKGKIKSRAKKALKDLQK